MFTSRIKHGAVGGLAGGVVFGMMMAMMGMLPMIGKMVGSANALVGLMVHMVISAGIGASFGVLSGSISNGRRGSVIAGAVYGMIWWVLGPLTMMPLAMGMSLGANWNLGAMQANMPSLMGHVIFGLVLGFVYNRVRDAGELRYGKEKSTLKPV